MKKYLENEWIQLILYIVVTIIMALIIFPVLDFLYSLITNNPFMYSIHEHIQRPIEFGIILGIISWVVQKEIKKKK